MGEPRTVDLGIGDIERIIELERRSFIPPLQVTAEKLRKRFALGHTMVGVEYQGDLTCMLSFAYGHFDPDHFATFPQSLDDICMLPRTEQFNAAYTYNLEVDPRYRGLRHYVLLAQRAAPRMLHDGCTYVVGNLRAPSYAGSRPNYKQERVPFRPEFRAAIDRFLTEGTFPAQGEFLNDPLLAFYYRITGCRFHWIMPHVAPDDHATGGHRVIGYQLVADWHAKIMRSGGEPQEPLALSPLHEK